MSKKWVFFLFKDQHTNRSKQGLFFVLLSCKESPSDRDYFSFWPYMLHLVGFPLGTLTHVLKMLIVKMFPPVEKKFPCQSYDLGE